MKKKIFSLILGICMVFSGMFAFSGCSIVTKDEEKANSAIMMKIGDTNVTKSDLINAFYTYYQNNSSYFAYYDEETIEESFYTWYTVKTMVSELSFKALYDETTNPSGFIYYTKDDAETVWESVEDYFYSQISAYEKALYTKEGISSTDDEYPSWLKDEDSSTDDEESVFETYEPATKDIEFTDRKANVVKKLTDEEVYAKVAELKLNLFKYVESTDDEGNETKAEITDSDQHKKRNQAYSNYLSALIANAKATDSETKREEVLKAEVLRIYKAYYDSQIGVIFQNYYVQEQLLNYNNNGDKTTLSDRSVVVAFLDAYYKDMQTNQIQDTYVATMEDSDGASLVLYHYQGKNYYFSVQHILLQFSDTILDQVKALYGYGVTNADGLIAEKYVDARNEIAENKQAGILTELNESAEKDTLISVYDYYYYDETKKDVWQEGSNPIYYGYVKLTNRTGFDSTTGLVIHNPIYLEGSEYVAGDGTLITKDSDGVKKMSNLTDVLDSYSQTYTKWVDCATEIYNGTSIDDFYEAKDASENLINEKYEALRYVLEVVEDMKANGANLEEVKDKVSSMLFIELEWIYSSDSLGNEISNKIGYICSSKPDNNMSWVVDFADGAREMLAEYKTKSLSDRSTFTKAVITDYGYHIMKIENVYDSASIIDLNSISAEFSLEAGSDYVNAVVSLLKKTYLCSTSNQTLYDYYYDSTYNTLAGSSSSSGTYFLQLEYSWLNSFYEDGKIQTFDKLTYDELIDSLS